LNPLLLNNSLTASADQPILLISDLHLSAQRPATTELAISYLANARGASALFILGDLFDYWLGDDAISPDTLPFITALSTLSQSGTDVYLMHGNRDFLLGEQFAKQVGATLIRDDEIIVSMNNQSVLLLHGDTLCTDDHGYQQLRSMLRAPAWQSEFLAKTIEQRIEMAMQLREQSQEAVAGANTVAWYWVIGTTHTQWLGVLTDGSLCWSVLAMIKKRDWFMVIHFFKGSLACQQ